MGSFWASTIRMILCLAPELNAMPCCAGVYLNGHEVEDEERRKRRRRRRRRRRRWQREKKKRRQSAIVKADKAEENILFLLVPLH